MVAKVVEILITGNSAQARSEIEKLVKTTDVAGKSIGSKLAAVGGTVAASVGIGAAAIAGVSLKLADDFEKSHARLEGAVKNTGGSMKVFEGQIDKVNSKLENLGFTNTQTEGALATLTRASGSTAKALNLMGLAADLAKARNISLDASVAILSKVVTGHVALLGRYGIATKDAAGNTLSVDEAISALSAKFGGQAATSAKTFSGHMEVLKAKAEDLGIKIGMFLIPILETLVDVTLNVVKWFGEHRDVAIALAAIVGGALVTAVVAYTVSMISAAVATIAATWPILAIIAVIALLIAAAYEVWTNWDKIWNWIATNPWLALVVSVVAAPIASFVLLIGALKELYDNWDSIWGAIESTTAAAGAFIIGVVDDVRQAIRDLTGLVSGSGSFGEDVDRARALQRSFANAPTFTAPGPYGGGLASGGLAMAGMTYTVGENGPETLVMGASGGRVIPHGSGGTQVIQLVVDSKVLAEVVRPHALRDARMGRSWN